MTAIWGIICRPEFLKYKAYESRSFTLIWNKISCFFCLLEKPSITGQSDQDQLLLKGPNTYEY